LLLFSYPYPKKLGDIEEGAYADILLIDGNPLINLSIFVDYEKILLLIIKDGVIYKNSLNKQYLHRLFKDLKLRFGTHNVLLIK